MVCGLKYHLKHEHKIITRIQWEIKYISSLCHYNLEYDPLT